MAMTAPNDPAQLDDSMRLLRDAFAESHVAKALLEAQQIRLLAMVYAVAEARTELGSTSAAANPQQEFTWNLRSAMGELGVEVRISDQALVNRAYHAHRVFTDFNEFWQALTEGAISYEHTRAVVRHASALEPEQLPEYGEKVLSYALTHTAPQTERFAAKLAAKLTANELAAAHQRAREERRVVIEHGEHGMSSLWAYLPTVEAIGIDDLLTRQARALQQDAKRDAEDQAANGVEDAVVDTRTHDQRRADVFIDTLVSATPAQILQSETRGAPRITASVSIVIPVLSLLNAPEGCRDVATVNGLSPIPTDVALQWAAQAPHLQRILTDPITGHVITVDSRMPDASLKRFLRARDVTCRFPGCMKAAERCDIDHTIPHESGGPTSEQNLAHVCRRHHVQKHQKGWDLEQLAGGVMVWRTPDGRRITTEPEPPGPKFVPDDPAPF